jgi:hypothetical protein
VIFLYSSNGHNSPKKLGIDLRSSDPLLDAYDALDAAWRKAEKDFAAMQVPVPVAHEISKWLDQQPFISGPETLLLAWTRYQNQWRICYVRRTQPLGNAFWNEETKPITECPMEIRVQLASELRPLREKMVEARSNYYSNVLEAIETLKQELAD